MGLDPNIVLQMLMQRRAEERDDLRRRDDDRQRMGQQEFALGLQLAQDPNFDVQKYIPTAGNLSPAKAGLLVELQTAHKKKLKSEQALNSAGATAATTPMGGGTLGANPNLDEVLASLRSVEAQQGPPSRGAFAPEVAESLAMVDTAAQQQASQSRASSAAFYADIEKQALIENLKEERKDRRAAAKLAAEQSGKNFSTAADRRKEFSGLQPVKDFVTQRNAMSRIVASAKDPSPAGDLALIFNYVKVLDPGSTVREGEFANVAASGAFGERIAGAVQQVSNGKRLTDVQRRDFVNRSKMLFQAAESDHNYLADQFKSQAKREGLDPKDVVIDFAPRISSSVDVPAPPPEVPDAQFVAKDKNGNPIFVDANGRRFVVEP